MQILGFILICLSFTTLYSMLIESVRFSCYQQMHVCSKSPVLNWRCRLMQVDLCNGRKMVVVVVLYVSNLYCFRDAASYLSKVANFNLPHLLLAPPPRWR